MVIKYTTGNIYIENSLPVIMAAERTIHMKTKLHLGLLKRARRCSKLSTQKVASILQRDRATVWRWETGKTDIPSNTLCRMLDLYGITPMDVFVRTQEEI